MKRSMVFKCGDWQLDLSYVIRGKCLSTKPNTASITTITARALLTFLIKVTRFKTVPKILYISDAIRGGVESHLIKHRRLLPVVVTTLTLITDDGQAFHILALLALRIQVQLVQLG